MKITCSIIVLLLMAAQAVAYVRRIHSRTGVSPALSTWIIFLIGTGISMESYIESKKENFLSGVMILADLAVVSLILSATVMWGNRTMRFRSFEKWYLVGCFAIVGYGITSVDYFGSNILAQILVTAGYLPTFQKLLREKHNTEPYAPWFLAMLSGIVGIIPAALGADALALIYSGRTVLLASIVLFLMDWCDRRAKRLA